MEMKWDIISIGNLSRNRYWGERDEEAYRTALCTSTLIRGENSCVLVDPPYRDAKTMSSELFRRTGLGVEDVDTVFLTHEHGDHTAGIEHFRHARWMAAPAVAHNLNTSAALSKSVDPAPERIFGCIDVMHTPGHTPDHHGLGFMWNGYNVVVAGDSVMTADFWDDRRGYFNSIDFEIATATIDMLGKTAHIVIPGHDNYFVVLSGPRG